MLERELGAGAASKFRSIDPEPLAAASIAQVHRATTLAGDQVVLKVRKRGLRRLVRQDLHVLRLLAEFLSSWPGMRLFDPEGLLRVFERTMERELNFDFERQSLDRVAAALKPDSLLRVPRVFSELSTSGVLTLEYLAGTKLSELRASPLPRESGEKVGVGIALGILEQVFEHGLYHADPHPGNFLLLADGRVGLIDFGNVGRFTPELQDDFFRLLYALLTREFKDVAAWILRHGKPSQELSAADLALELAEVLDPYYGLQLADISLGGMFNSLFTLVLRHGISIPAPYVTVGRAIVSLEGTVRLCAPEVEVLGAIRPYILRLLAERFSPRRVLKDLRREAQDILAALRTYPGNISEVLSRLAEGRLRLEARIPELERIERSIEHSSSRTQLSLLVVGLLIGSALLLFRLPTGSDSLRTILGVSGFLLGLLLTVKVALGR